MATRRFPNRKARNRRARPDRTPEPVAVDPDELTGLFRVPGWLRRIGISAWLLVGVALLIAVLVWIASLTEVIVIPMIVAAIISAVLSPVVDRLAAMGLPRGLGAALVLLGLAAIGFGLTLLMLRGIVGEAGAIEDQLKGAMGSITDALGGLGLPDSTAKDASSRLSSGGSDAVSVLLSGILSGLQGLASLVFFTAMLALGIFFMLKDAPVIGAWIESHSGLPQGVARTVSSRVVKSMQGYFIGTTMVAAFSAAVVAIGSLVIGVPQIAAIVTVTFIAGYIPYLGAWGAGIFSVLIALGAGGVPAAVGMIVVQVLANAVLQQLIQPLAMGASLRIHPLVVLVVTIAGGALFGTIGLVISAPLVAAAVRIGTDLKAIREAAGGTGSTGDAEPLAAGP